MKKATTGTVVSVALAAAVALALVFGRGTAADAVYPVEKAKVTFARQIGSRLKGLVRGAAAGAENVRLRREAATLAMVEADNGRLFQENVRLRRLLGYDAFPAERWLPAEVLSFGGGASGARQICRVGKGSLAGVKEGAMVAVPDGLVGRVTSVSLKTAEVLLVTDPAFKVACEIEGSGGVRGISAGGSGERIFLKHLTSAAEVPPRARVLTSGRGGLFPRGLAIGTLLTIHNAAEGRPSPVGEAVPAVDFSTLEDVFIRCEK